jgi:polysaccharide pyruvyl transferase WcaK-like protein
VSRRVGLFGYLGSGNSGNEASTEVVLAYLRTDHPGAVVDAMSGGASRVREKHGIDAISMTWFERYERRVPQPAAGALKILGKGLDVIRTASWVRRHDAVIIPGGGALETTLPMRPWGYPFGLFLVCASGRLFGTKVALVDIGASPISVRSTRWLSNSVARLAYYRSFRDELSREAVRQRGIDTSGDQVYPDLVFGVPVPAKVSPGSLDTGSLDTGTVGLGLMAYYGSNDDRQRADEVHTSYVETMKAFARWLIDNDYRIRLFGGDSKWDDAIADEVVADLQRYRPGLQAGRVVAQPAGSYAELLAGMALVDVVVATRYHNVMGALKLGKPTIALGYSEKFTSLMASMGLAEFVQHAYDVNLDRLVEQFKDLTSRQLELRKVMAENNESNEQALAQQFKELSAALFSGARAAG